eukprot:1467124-Pyramimonas_sp.AAC.1
MPIHMHAQLRGAYIVLCIPLDALALRYGTRFLCSRVTGRVFQEKKKQKSAPAAGYAGEEPPP